MTTETIRPHIDEQGEPTCSGEECPKYYGYKTANGGPAPHCDDDLADCGQCEKGFVCVPALRALIVKRTAERDAERKLRLVTQEMHRSAEDECLELHDMRKALEYIVARWRTQIGPPDPVWHLMHDIHMMRPEKCVEYVVERCIALYELAVSKVKP